MILLRLCLRFLFVFALLVISFFSGFVFAGDGSALTERLSCGSINWTKGVITATGNGAPPSSSMKAAQARLMAKRAAILDARRNLLETVKGVRINAQTTVHNFMIINDIVVTKVNGIVKLSRVIETKYMSDGAVQVTVAINLRGDLLELMLQESGAFKRPYTPGTMQIKEPYTATQPSSFDVLQRKTSKPTPPQISSTVEPSGKQVVKPEVKGTTEENTPADLDLSELNYSGLVVDARRLQLRPALIPKIWDQRGEVVYSASNLLQKDALKMGIVGYAKDVDAAKRNQRVTAIPFVVKGVQATGQKRTDVIIGNRDAMIVKGSDRYTNYLKNGRVLIVYD